jgi:hypothetical protein
VSPTWLISQALLAGGLAGARPFLTLLVLASSVRLYSDASLPVDVSWLLHPVSLAALAVLSYLEHEARTEPDFEETLRRPLQLLSAVAGGLVGRLLSSEQLWSDEAAPIGSSMLAVAAASAGSLVVQDLRRRLLDAADELLDVGNWWRRLEAGGVVGLLVVIVTFPFLALALVVVFTIVGAAVGLGLRGFRSAREQAARQPCAHCSHAIRKEASRCPNCKTTVSPAVVLS